MRPEACSTASVHHKEYLHVVYSSVVHFCVFFCLSNRLQLLSPFDKWDGKDLEDMTILIKVIINNYKETVLTYVINPCLALRQTVSWLRYGECEPEALCMKFQEYS